MFTGEAGKKKTLPQTDKKMQDHHVFFFSRIKIDIFNGTCAVVLCAYRIDIFICTYINEKIKTSWNKLIWRMHTLGPNFGWATCHIMCIDFSVCSGSSPPTKVITPKHWSNCCQSIAISNIKLSIHKVKYNMQYELNYKMWRTDKVLVASGRILKASDIGESDSSKISWAFSPGPAVRAKRPEKMNKKKSKFIETISKQWNAGYNVSKAGWNL